ncbi:hypothetical protein OQH61_04025 [Helicobacter sp. MIT 21-1697]|uniref:hypothetical protein n=1 Tax=Helicobacter sp. MIT 21-1697 TaxID=2993733 RepID=UPI00224B32BD|nr:hypothetical protein [Helicobacter sp. MIT 21-1697]MCX2716899.1 hypothetical protein [Helicobacter sp. MIT 21-1697]
MKKIVTLIGSVVLLGLLSGCGNDFKCDNKNYAEQALNLLLFENAKGGEDKYITLKSLGFEVGEITLMELDKDKKSSICKAKISNTHLKTAFEKIQQARSGKDITKGLDKEAQERMNAFAAATNDFGAPLVMEELYQSIKGDRKQDEILSTPQDFITLYGIAKVAVKLFENGLAYRTFDNGNGDLMIEANFAE